MVQKSVNGGPAGLAIIWFCHGNACGGGEVLIWRGLLRANTRTR
jgi:hypothetical protein